MYGILHLKFYSKSFKLTDTPKMVHRSTNTKIIFLKQIKRFKQNQTKIKQCFFSEYFISEKVVKLKIIINYPHIVLIVFQIYLRDEILTIIVIYIQHQAGAYPEIRFQIKDFNTFIIFTRTQFLIEFFNCKLILIKNSFNVCFVYIL